MNPTELEELYERFARQLPANNEWPNKLVILMMMSEVERITRNRAVTLIDEMRIQVNNMAY